MKSNNKVSLREVKESDLEIFFTQQQDTDANFMAAFISRDPNNKRAFDKHWKKILLDDSVIIMTIVYQKKVVGHIASYILFGEREITYWIGKDFWGKGIASSALEKFINLVKVRPLHARAAKDNLASIRVLEKCGFNYIGNDLTFSQYRNEDVEEVIYKLS